MGTVESGVRSEDIEGNARRIAGREKAIRGGEEDMIWVDDVGTGVG